LSALGEEVYAGLGWRTTTQGYTAAGYSAADKARQKFTVQERDDETGMDFMQARYYSNVQGRFASADSVAGAVGNPQSMNRYSYVGNDPIN
jgi:RHS repeat-associated protein